MHVLGREKSESNKKQMGRKKYFIKSKKWIMAKWRERIYMNNNKHDVSNESLHDK